jgi:hypothetical protein
VISFDTGEPPPHPVNNIMKMERVNTLGVIILDIGFLLEVPLKGLDIRPFRIYQIAGVVNQKKVEYIDTSILEEIN